MNSSLCDFSGRATEFSCLITETNAGPGTRENISDARIGVLIIHRSTIFSLSSYNFLAVRLLFDRFEDLAIRHL